MKDEKCPMCPNHCLKNSLNCKRGIEYFSNLNNNSKSKTLNEEVIIDLRKCGHLLHHNKDLDTNKILSVFSTNELNTLHELLSKIHNDK